MSKLTDLIFGPSSQSDQLGGSAGNSSTPKGAFGAGGAGGAGIASVYGTCGCGGAGACMYCLISQVYGPMATQYGLSKEEQEELQKLAKDREAAVKQEKIKIFKGLGAPLRQRVVDKILWRKACADMGAVQVPMSERENELRKRAGYNRSDYSVGGYHSGLSPFGDRTVRDFEVPEGLTSQDLIDAHQEACLEEVLSPGEKHEQKEE